MAHPRDRIPYLSRETLFERIEALEARIIALTAIIQNQAEDKPPAALELPDDGMA